MVVSRRDDAISEVIGFVLIIALIAIVASLYLTYVVPAQGRDLEIAHMDVVQNQFLDYKTTVDSLWINNRFNTQISSPFTLGTNPGSTQGSFVNMPLFQPVASGGTLVVNGRTDTVGVSANAIFTAHIPGASPLNPIIQFEPEHLYVNFQAADITKLDSVNIKPTLGNWEVNISTMPELSATNLIITIKENGAITINNSIIQNSISNNQPYQIDLADTTFGLKDSFVYPFNLTISNGSFDTCSRIAYYGVQNGLVIPQNTQMGSFEYHSNNNYWISQNYMYQYGGVFLIQNTGGIVKLVPSITITQDLKDPSLTRVTINNITIRGAVPSKVGGSSLVEVLTTLKKPDIAANGLVNSDESGMPNASNVTIIVTTVGDSQSANMWVDTFKKIRQSSNIPDSGKMIIIPDLSPGSTSAKMTIYGPSIGANYDIILDTQNNIANIYLSPTSYT